MALLNQESRLITGSADSELRAWDINYLQEVSTEELQLAFYTHNYIFWTIMKRSKISYLNKRLVESFTLSWFVRRSGQRGW